MYVYVCMCVCIYVYMYICICIYIYIYIKRNHIRKVNTVPRIFNIYLYTCAYSLLSSPHLSSPHLTSPLPLPLPLPLLSSPLLSSQLFTQSHTPNIKL